MIRGAVRELFQSARQVRRASARQARKQHRVRMADRQPEGSRRTICDLAREESVITNQQKQRFGRMRYNELVPRVVTVGSFSIFDIGAIDALNVRLQDLTDDDDDGR